jgi:sarcosine oxidase subunit alpha
MSAAFPLDALIPLDDLGSPITFTFEGRTIHARSGQSVGAALYATGVRIFTRSFKYHRPRGLFCVAGDCPNCLMNVDGRPNVRTCIEPARDGQVVTHQNAWPSLDYDALRVFDKLDRFLPVGFYYKRFHRPAWLWPIFEHAVRHIAGLGRVEILDLPDGEAAVDHAHTDVCVIGSGPSGLAAVAAARQGGANVLLIEREPRLGGHLYLDEKRQGLLRQLEEETAKGPGGLEICRNFAAFGLYEGNLIGAVGPDSLVKVRARQIIVCTGGRQQPFLFHNNDLPGIMLGNGALRLTRLHGVRAGRRAVILTNSDDGHTLAEQLETLGIEVAAVVDQRSTAAGQSKRTVLTGATVLEARGNKQLRSVRIGRVGAEGKLEAGSVQEIACDLLCLASGLVPANELLLMAGVRFHQSKGCWIPENTVLGTHAAGAAAGTFNLDEQIREGRQRGALAAALALGHAPPPCDAAVPPSACPIVAAPREDGQSKRFVCLCEDVTQKDIEQAVAEGFDHVETLKRYTTVNMGPCQGKVCGLTAATLCARLTGRDPDCVGLTTSRPPVVPVEMGVLAADRHFHPIRRTPLHHWHEHAGARWMDAGQWKRPEHYGDPAEEVCAVRSGVGLIDVGTLGKLEISGPDAGELLERVYLNKWTDLKPSRARYGVMCNEDGIVFDDGVGARLAPDRFYLTATTGNADGVFQWLEMWRDIWRLRATVLNHTAAVAAMNLAGPLSRPVLERLTKLDLSPPSFPYMTLREAEIAAVPCRLLRIGFVGELGYEIHCPSSQAWHVWEALLEAGKDHGLRPFGVEAQRILRLEKGHFIVGVDTDALSNALDAGLEWLVRFDKPQFHGREPLLRLKSLTPRARLVGFVMESDTIPDEGCQVVERGAPVGRVTSVRHSPTLGRIIGLAWVPAARATPGRRFTIRHAGRDAPAIVAPLPFYDSDGERLKS